MSASQGDGRDVGERLVVDRDRQRDEQRRDDEVGDAGDAASFRCAHRGSLSRIVITSMAAHPVILTVVVEPQIAKLRKKSATTTVTIEVRIALPTARPTPAGPPLALKP